MVNLETELRFVTPVPGKIDLGSADCVTEKGEQVIWDGGEWEMKEKKKEEKEKEKGEEKEGDDDDLFQVTCTQLSLCLRYSGTGVADTLEVLPRHHRLPPHDHHCDNNLTHDHQHRLHPHDPNLHHHRVPPCDHHRHHRHNLQDLDHNFAITRLRLRWSWTLASSSPLVCSSLQGRRRASGDKG